MKIIDLTQRTPHGYSFSVQIGPFIIHNWWYNLDHENVIPPSRYVDDRRYPVVSMPGNYMRNLRNLIKAMVKLGRTDYNSDYEFSLIMEEPKKDEQQDTAAAK